jgi:outer membrane assembly lipoprotein YfiO
MGRNFDEGRRCGRVRLAAVGMALTIAGVAAGLGGCGASNPYPVGSFDRGERFSARGKHHEAIDALDSFIRRNPTDSLSARAQYLKALSYMELKEYPLAAVELQILRKDFPASEFAEDAFYQEGLAYLNQVGRIQRDVSGAYEARAHFRKFLAQYPDSPHVPQVQEHLRHISDIIVSKRISAADVFEHLGRHAAAGLVLQSTYEEEKESRLLDKVLFLRGQMAAKAGERGTAAEAYQRLLADYPDSKFAAAARVALAGLARADKS